MFGRLRKTNTSLTTDSAPLSDEAAKAKRLNSLLLNMAMCLLVIFMGIWGTTWLLSDVTGEYTSNDPELGTVRMSIVRRATNFKGELSYGSGAMLEMNTAQLPAEKKLDLIFEIPQKWVDEGQNFRSVKFHGMIKDGTISGVIQDGSAVFPIKLEKDGLSSLHRQIQSHLPFNG